jgi:ABC-type polysaccharide/polyol phosphate export permease
MTNSEFPYLDESYRGGRGFFADIDRDLLSAVRKSSLWTALGWNDIRQRYRRSVLGPFWITLSMAVFITVLGVIYSNIFKIELRTYLPYLTLGYIIWGFVSTTTSESSIAFQESERIIRQIRLPYSIFILRVVWRNFIVFLHTIVIFVPVAMFYDVRPGLVGLLALPGLALDIAMCNRSWPRQFN